MPSSFRLKTGAQFALFRSVAFPLLRPTGFQSPFQGDLSEGSVLFTEFLLFYHLGRQERKRQFPNAASAKQICEF